MEAAAAAAESGNGGRDGNSKEVAGSKESLKLTGKAEISWRRRDNMRIEE